MAPTKIKEEVRAKIIEANPDLLKLSFGCEVEKEGEVYKLAMVKVKGMFEKTLEDYWSCVDKKEQPVALQKNIRTKIIGHPITLADVLIVFKEQKFSQVEWEVNYWKMLRLWNLKETYDNQSEDCISFLHMILCKHDK